MNEILWQIMHFFHLVAPLWAKGLIGKRIMRISALWSFQFFTLDTCTLSPSLCFSLPQSLFLFSQVFTLSRDVPLCAKGPLSVLVNDPRSWQSGHNHGTTQNCRFFEHPSSIPQLLGDVCPGICVRHTFTFAHRHSEVKLHLKDFKHTCLYLVFVSVLSV